MSQNMKTLLLNMKFYNFSRKVWQVTALSWTFFAGGGHRGARIFTGGRVPPVPLEPPLVWMCVGLGLFVGLSVQLRAALLKNGWWILMKFSGGMVVEINPKSAWSCVVVKGRRNVTDEKFATEGRARGLNTGEHTPRGSREVRVCGDQHCHECYHSYATYCRT